MTLFLDTNVLIDHALMRQTGQPLEVTYIIFWAENLRVPLFMSSGSFYTFTYVLQKNGIRGDDLKIKLKQYLSLVNVVNSDNKTLSKALDSSFKDIEDSFQYMTATNEGCDYLITSNIADFKKHGKSKALPITPLDFVSKILGKKKGVDY